MKGFNSNHYLFALSCGVSCMTRYAAILGVAAIVATTQSMAMQRDTTPGNNYPTKDELEDDGYDCEYVATNFWVCEKDGEKTYWCDSTGQCVPKPFKIGPQKPFYRFHQQRTNSNAILAR